MTQGTQLDAKVRIVGYLSSVNFILGLGCCLVSKGARRCHSAGDCVEGDVSRNTGGYAGACERDSRNVQAVGSLPRSCDIRLNKVVTVEMQICQTWWLCTVLRVL